MPAFTPVNPEWRLQNAKSGSRLWFFPDKRNDDCGEQSKILEEDIVLPHVQSKQSNQPSELATNPKPVNNDFRQVEGACPADADNECFTPNTFDELLEEIEREDRLEKLYDKLATIPDFDELETPIMSDADIELLEKNSREISEKPLDSDTDSEIIIMSVLPATDCKQRPLQTSKSTSFNEQSTDALMQEKQMTPKTLGYSLAECYTSYKKYDGIGPLVVVPKLSTLPKEEQQPEVLFTTEDTHYLHKYETRNRSPVLIEDMLGRKSRKRRKQLRKVRKLRASTSASAKTSPQYIESFSKQAASAIQIAKDQRSAQSSPSSTPNSGSLHVDICAKKHRGILQAGGGNSTKAPEAGQKPLTASLNTNKDKPSEKHAHDGKQIVNNTNCRTYSFEMSGRLISYTKHCNPEKIDPS